MPSHAEGDRTVQSSFGPTAGVKKSFFGALNIHPSEDDGEGFSEGSRSAVTTELALGRAAPKQLKHFEKNSDESCKEEKLFHSMKVFNKN